MTTTPQANESQWTMTAQAKQLIFTYYGQRVLDHCMSDAVDKHMDWMCASAALDALLTISGNALDNDSTHMSAALELVQWCYGAVVVQNCTSVAHGADVHWLTSAHVEHLLCTLCGKDKTSTSYACAVEMLRNTYAAPVLLMII